MCFIDDGTIVIDSSQNVGISMSRRWPPVRVVGDGVFSDSVDSLFECVDSNHAIIAASQPDSTAKRSTPGFGAHLPLWESGSATTVSC
jgi:hypothetical protein